jgi:hypothetical protein
MRHRKIERELKAEFPFAVISTTGKAHYRLRLPNGKVIFTSATPSCAFARHNVRADVKRAMRHGR